MLAPRAILATRLSQVLRKTVEHPFGWLKAAAGMWQVKVRGKARVRVGLHLRYGGLQPDPNAKPLRSGRSTPAIQPSEWSYGQNRAREGAASPARSAPQAEDEPEAEEAALVGREHAAGPRAEIRFSEETSQWREARLRGLERTRDGIEAHASEMSPSPRQGHGRKGAARTGGNSCGEPCAPSRCSHPARRPGRGEGVTQSRRGADGEALEASSEGRELVAEEALEGPSRHEMRQCPDPRRRPRRRGR